MSSAPGVVGGGFASGSGPAAAAFGRAGAVFAAGVVGMGNCSWGTAVVGLAGVAGPLRNPAGTAPGGGSGSRPRSRRMTVAGRLVGTIGIVRMTGSAGAVGLDSDTVGCRSGATAGGWFVGLLRFDDAPPAGEGRAPVSVLLRPSFGGRVMLRGFASLRPARTLDQKASRSPSGPAPVERKASSMPSARASARPMNEPDTGPVFSAVAEGRRGPLGEPIGAASLPRARDGGTRSF